MFKLFRNLFKTKPKENKTIEPYYPIKEINEELENYKNKQHKKAMKAPIDLDKLRNKGL